MDPTQNPKCDLCSLPHRVAVKYGNQTISLCWQCLAKAEKTDVNYHWWFTTDERNPAVTNEWIRLNLEYTMRETMRGIANHAGIRHTAASDKPAKMVGLLDYLRDSAESNDPE